MVRARPDGVTKFDRRIYVQYLTSVQVGEERNANARRTHKALEKKGYLRREDLKSRAMRPITPISSARSARGTAMGEEFIDVPILGRVAAGEPLLAVENHEDTVRVDRFFLGNNREVFALRVVGESMIEDGIHDGDYVFVKKTPTANRGDTVVAMIEGEATVKRYHPEGDQIRFQPANAAMEPIIVRREDFRSVDLIGRVVGVYRRM